MLEKALVGRSGYLAWAEVAYGADCFPDTIKHRIQDILQTMRQSLSEFTYVITAYLVGGNHPMEEFGICFDDAYFPFSFRLLEAIGS